MPSRRGAVLGAAVVVTAGLATASVLATRDDSASTMRRPRRSETLQPVATRSLETTTDVSGTIGYGTTTTVRLSGAGSSSTSTAASPAASGTSSTSTGTITGLPAVGTVIAPGQSLAEIDGSPSAFLMVGTRPMWRTLQRGVADGADVRQLEQTLAMLGYGEDVTIDDEFTSGTTSAIEAWRVANGLDETGSLTTTDIVFLPGSVRVASQAATIGAAASGDVLTVTGTTPLVHVDLDASDVASVHAGDVVKMELPDGSTIDGTILGVGTATSASTTAQGGQGSTTTTTVGVEIVAGDADIAAFDGASAVIHLVSSKAEAVLSVPVKSLLALAEGGYAVERVRNGRHSLVAVKPGVFAGGFVQVSGELEDGDRVVTP